MAYNADGTPKRSIGVWYPDIGGPYTQEMADEENGRTTNTNQKQVYKTRGRKRKKA